MHLPFTCCITTCPIFCSSCHLEKVLFVCGHHKLDLDEMTVTLASGQWVAERDRQTGLDMAGQPATSCDDENEHQRKDVDRAGNRHGRQNIQYKRTPCNRQNSKEDKDKKQVLTDKPVSGTIATDRQDTYCVDSMDKSANESRLSSSEAVDGIVSKFPKSTAPGCPSENADQPLTEVTVKPSQENRRHPGNSASSDQPTSPTRKRTKLKCVKSNGDSISKCSRQKKSEKARNVDDGRNKLPMKKRKCSASCTGKKKATQVSPKVNAKKNHVETGSRNQCSGPKGSDADIDNSLEEDEEVTSCCSSVTRLSNGRLLEKYKDCLGSEFSFTTNRCFLCSESARNFASEWELLSHIDTEHYAELPDGKYRIDCPLCTKQFVISNPHRKSGMVVVDATKRHSARLVKKRLPIYIDHLLHSHNLDIGDCLKLFRCPVGDCSYRCAWKPHMLWHIKSHNMGDYTKECTHCSKAFPDYHIVSHERICGEKKRVACQQCGKLLYNTNLKAHIRKTHRGERGEGLLCTDCSYHCMSRPQFNHHMYMVCTHLYTTTVVHTF